MLLVCDVLTMLWRSFPSRLNGTAGCYVLEKEMYKENEKGMGRKGTNGGLVLVVVLIVVVMKRAM